MKVLLSTLILVLIGLQTFSLDASFALGLSVKNLLLYVTFVGIAVRMALARSFKLELASLQACFVFLLAYATVSFLIVYFAIKYPGYDLVVGIATLKTNVFDHLIFFLVFFYGLQALDDALAVTDALLFGVVFANVITVLDASGVLGLNVIAVRTSYAEEIGRVQGAFGEANQHAAIVALTLPVTLAKVFMSRGPLRLFWAAGVAFGLAALFMTISRGAMAGLLLATVWGCIAFRRYLSLGEAAKWAGIGVVLVGIVLVALSANYTEMLRDRVFGLTFSIDAADASSGRTMLWQTIFSRMMDAPWSLLTGYGWQVYQLIFDFAPHNSYLGMWFNLGLPGLVAFLLLLWHVVSTARAAVDAADATIRPYLVGFTIGFAALCISVFFVDLYMPWLYVWAYVGMTMRVAVGVFESARVAAPQDLEARKPDVGPRYGWSARTAERRKSAAADRAG